MSTHLIVKSNAEQLACAARDWLVKQINLAIAERERCLLAASGGSTPKRLYELLAELPSGTVDWSHVHWIWGDERNVPLDHPDSNFLMVRTALLDKLGRHGPNVYPVLIDPQDPAHAAEYYESTLRSLCQAKVQEEWPQIDIVLLGLGDDSHTASLFPGSPGLQETEKWVVSHWIEKLQTFRISLTAPVLNAARQVAFLVSGAGKQVALQHVWHDPYQPELYPAQLIRVKPGETWWMVDEAAVENVAIPKGMRRLG